MDRRGRRDAGQLRHPLIRERECEQVPARFGGFDGGDDVGAPGRPEESCEGEDIYSGAKG
jgi:hypothetical protein